jgi:hypothetical protein
MVYVGVGFTLLTVLAMVAGYFHEPHRRPFPNYGWLGIVSLAGAELLMFRGVQPFATYFTPIAWSSYILIVDAAVFSITGRSRLRDAPVTFARMAFLSIPLWLIFEAYNLRLQNWNYAGVPPGWVSVVFGYCWSFATITPAIFETADFAQAVLPPLRVEPWKVPPKVDWVFIAIGCIFLIVPVAIPAQMGAYLFVLIWLGFIFLLDPINRRLGLPSFLSDLAEGFRRRLYGFLASGWICGWLWEFWNNWALGKWHYTFPMFQQWKIFQMPAPGYLGFLPFALEVFTMYVTASWLAGWRRRDP